ncbi:MAG TPA: aspartate dehydrogenase [bacterium]
MKHPLRIGLLGYGAIGKRVIAAIADGTIASATCPAALVRRQRSEPGVTLTADPAAFFRHDYDVVVECAGHQAVRDHALTALERGADLMVTSVGAFVDDALLERVTSAAKAAGRRLLLPSAGIGALDILTAGAVGGLESVTMTVIKDATSWLGTEAERTHDLRNLAAPVVLYEGPVREGARRYPQNVNISAAVALAGIGLDKTQLRIVADPAPIPHVVEIQARGYFGNFSFREEIIPSDENQKTGRLVVLAVVKALQQLAASVVIGG